jgi:hypothetical protein
MGGLGAAVSASDEIARDKHGAALFGKGASANPARSRRWITDRHVRGMVSSTNGSPSAGKSSLAVTYGHAIVTGRPGLAGLDRVERPGDVVIIAADGERASEFKLKSDALRKHHGLANTDFAHEFRVIEDVGPFVEKYPDGAWGPSHWLIGKARQLADYREHGKLSVIFVDTLLGVSGSGNTADAVDMQAIMEVAKTLAADLDCSVDLLNHLTKGGAKDPTNMDSAQGARPVTATPRFAANLTRAGGLVRMTMAKETYFGPKGCPAFEFKSVDVAVEVYDEDFKLMRTGTEKVGVLAPAPRNVAAAFALGDAHQALWQSQQTGVRIKRGARKGKRGSDHASLIVEAAVNLGPKGDAETRRKAEALVDQLVKDQRAKIETARDGSRNKPVRFLDVSEPPEEV